METFLIKDAFKWGWQRFKEIPWFFIKVVLLVFVISVVFGILGDNKFVGSLGIVGISQFAGTIVQWWLMLGFMTILLNVCDSKPVLFNQLFSANWRTLWHYILATILYTLIVFGGLILFIVPGIVWGIKFHYYMYLIVDKNMGPIESLKKSAKITSGYKWQLFGFMFLSGLVMLTGFIALGIGALVAFPVVMLSGVWVYRWLEAHTNTPLQTQE